jgi:hypothetical protein
MIVMRILIECFTGQFLLHSSGKHAVCVMSMRPETVGSTQTQMLQFMCLPHVAEKYRTEPARL